MIPADLSALRVEIVDSVALVAIDHPPINLFDIVLYPEMTRVVEALASDDSVRAVVFRSAVAEFFIAHFDVSLILRLPTDSGRPSTLNDFHRMCETLRTMPKPTIAAIDGRVGGGGSEFALSCDMRFASPRSILCQPEVPLGIIPGGSGTVRLSRLVGRSRAMEVILAGDDVDAVTAEEWGWVNRVVDDPVSHSMALARRIASFPPGAVRAAKRSVLRAEDHVVEDLLDEAAEFNATLGDPSARRAMQNFLARGGQTPDGERRLGRLAGDLGD